MDSIGEFEEVDCIHQRRLYYSILSSVVTILLYVTQMVSMCGVFHLLRYQRVH